MALGSTAIADVTNYNSKITTNIGEIHDCWNTFQYVLKGLSKWADETMVGNELRNDLISFTERIDEIHNSTKKLQNVLTEFIERQTKINNG